jgi:hypothetical protein
MVSQERLSSRTVRSISALLIMPPAHRLLARSGLTTRPMPQRGGPDRSDIRIDRNFGRIALGRTFRLYRIARLVGVYARIDCLHDCNAAESASESHPTRPVCGHNA